MEKPFVNVDTLVFEKIVKDAVCEMLHNKTFFDVARHNWATNKGNEEVLYPFLSELIRCRLPWDIQGIGCGRYNNRTEKGDCICYFEGDTFAVELKGPSRDGNYISKGLEEDISKLKQLMNEGIISFGVAVGLQLSDDNDCGKAEFIFTVNSTKIGVYLHILNTQQV